MIGRNEMPLKFQPVLIGHLWNATGAQKDTSETLGKATGAQKDTSGAVFSDPQVSNRQHTYITTPLPLPIPTMGAVIWA